MDQQSPSRNQTSEQNLSETSRRIPARITLMLRMHDKSDRQDAQWLRTELRRRMNRPQRHRLLHGFPLAAAMPFATHEVRERAAAGDTRYCPAHQTDRGLLVGVLPHSFCNPKVPACGFCTFPHEQFTSIKAAAVVAGVIQEIGCRVTQENGLAGRRVQGLYFGGGTANLTPAEPLRRLCRKLNEVFDLRDAEVTLEGVPAYFVKRTPSLLDVLRDELPARHFRISMGIQTFSRQRLEQMGRLAFGGPETFREVVADAHSRGFTVSGDLLFNLPSQTLPEMHSDVSRAVEVGLDQICLYHLVMFRGLGAPWARDEAVLAALPDNPTAAGNWVSLRRRLMAHGYHQTTLTNFERSELRNDPRRYQYELFSFQPDQFDMLGFGPTGISFTCSSPGEYGLKTMNPESSSEYLQAVRQTGPVWNRYFEFDRSALKLFLATRHLAALRIDRERYGRVTGSDVTNDFPAEIDALNDEGLLQVDERQVVPTDRGMFYADTIAAILATRTLHRVRTGAQHASSFWLPTNDNDQGFM
jgi:coproporphyrinogen III oxidase-like Fe-S oxidoreductase